MPFSQKTQKILAQIDSSTKLGDLRKMAKEIKKDHPLAMELWGTGSLLPRLLAILILDGKQLDQELIDQLTEDMQAHPLGERTQLMDWLMANQLAKDKKTMVLMESWENNPSPLQRRTFWYYQARLRWLGQAAPPNTATLLSAIEKQIKDESPEVQWAMNFTAGWIGIYDKPYRERCIAVGEKTGLYKGKMVSKGCTPDYLPEFIAIESAKRNL